MESHTTALDRLLDSDHLRFLLSIPITPFPGAHTYDERGKNIFIKILAFITPLICGLRRSRVAHSNQGGKIDRQPVLSTAADGTNRNISTGRGFLQTGHPGEEGVPRSTEILHIFQENRQYYINTHIIRSIFLSYIP